MEAASLRRGNFGSVAQAVREAVRTRSRAFWIVAGLTVLAAVLRLATIGVQSYHHDEIVTASRVLRDGFGHAMSAVSFSESTPPLYYALAWAWTQVTGTGAAGLRSLSALAGVATIPFVYLIGLELRDRRAGLMAAALAAVNPMLLWYSQEARAYSLLVLLCAASLLWCVRSLRSGERRDLILWGVFSALALATHYFAVFPLIAEACLLLRRRGRATAAGLWIVVLTGLALAPLAIHQMSANRAEWIGRFSLGHRVWETVATFLTGETGDIIGRPEHPGFSLLPLALVFAALAVLALRSDRGSRRAVLTPLCVGAAAAGIPILLALLAASKDYVIARNLLPALIPLLLVVAIATTMPTARRLGTAIGAALFVYSLGFCVWASVSPDLQRPDWSEIAGRLGEPTAPRATVLWALGEAPLRYYLSTGAIQVRSEEANPWLVHEIDFVSEGEVPPPSRSVIGPPFREVAAEGTGRLFIRRYRVPGPGLEPLRIRELRRADLDWRTNGVLLDGVGPG